MPTTDMYAFPIGSTVRVKNIYWKSSVDGNWIVESYLQKNIQLRRSDDYHGWDKKKKLRAKPHHIQLVLPPPSAKALDAQKAWNDPITWNNPITKTYSSSHQEHESSLSQTDVASPSPSPSPSPSQPSSWKAKFTPGTIVLVRPPKFYETETSIIFGQTEIKGVMFVVVKWNPTTVNIAHLFGTKHGEIFLDVPHTWLVELPKEDLTITYQPK